MIVNTRPASLSENINLLARDQMLDIKNIHLSILEPNESSLDNQRFDLYVGKISAYKNIIFTSQSAVKFGSKILNLRDLSKVFDGEVYSIGPATSLELQKIGINPVVAQSHNSEGLLGTIKNKVGRSLLFCGKNSRGYLKDNLTNLDVIDCYDLVFNASELNQLDESDEIILVYNFKTLDFIVSSLDIEILNSKVFIVASNRILEQLKESRKNIKGLKVYVADEPSDLQMLKKASSFI
ncbi:uroporphyrinogen-III synthase [Gammaproteobacteria bacterium]|jgi:uroporphyrinogen-III synthase|nr:uroporphyrinogen-III synthase [Gammaproteobacteria bacterium]MDC3247890.1 uroporphyrinogen-III synthase [Gammaproteobacteria bacterium]